MILVHGKDGCKYTEAILEHLGSEAERFTPEIRNLRPFRSSSDLCTVAAQEAGFGWDRINEDYARATVMIQVLPDTANDHLVSSGAKISYKTLTEFAPVVELVNRLKLKLVVIDDGFSGMHSWVKWPELENTGKVPAVVVSDFAMFHNQDEQWRRVLDQWDDIEVYGKGWEGFSGWDSKRFMGPVSEGEASAILSTAKCTPVVDWHSCEPYRAIAAGCLPIEVGNSADCVKDYVSKVFTSPNWRELHARIKMD
ncbi:hypothetical protein LCGC14_0357140 [marine sediment metagenome]|uniref:Uncharacterized protein n=1 Tax=marine sediment metagenome TaxID=412755 RepID=A0A0F9T942_9ZZZZ